MCCGDVMGLGDVMVCDGMGDNRAVSFLTIILYIYSYESM